MGQFFSLDWNGAPFQLFGTYHLIALGIILLVNVWLFYFKGHSSETARRNFRYGLAVVLVIDELGWHYWNWSTGQWTIQTMLPLHVCSVLVWLGAYMLVKKNYSIYEFAYLLGIASALQALLTPDAGAYGFPHFRAIQVMLSHGAIVTSAMYMTVVEGFRPTWRSVKHVLIGGNLYMLAVGLINWLIGSNYMFIAHKPATASLLDVLPPWPWYLLYLEALGLVFMLLFYLPFAISDWRKGRANKLKTDVESGLNG
jgi:hypothetical integral membrane protein (TIGR02206 family)